MDMQQQTVDELKKAGVGVTIYTSEDGFLHLVNWPGDSVEYFLDTQQLLHLKQSGKLTLAGVRELNASEIATVQKDIEAARAEIGAEKMQGMFAKQICGYINQKFNRIHSTGQIAAVLDRLHYTYRKF